MWFRRILPVFLGICAGLIDATVSVWLPGSLAGIRAALPLALLFAAFSSPMRAVGVALSAGIVMDLLQPTMGFASVHLLIAVGVVVAVSRRYVTNRSLIGSLALGFVGFCTDRALLAVIGEHPPSMLVEGGWVLVCLAGAFFLFAAFTRRFLPLMGRGIRPS